MTIRLDILERLWPSYLLSGENLHHFDVGGGVVGISVCYILSLSVYTQALPKQPCTLSLCLVPSRQFGTFFISLMTIVKLDGMTHAGQQSFKFRYSETATFLKLEEGRGDSTECL